MSDSKGLSQDPQTNARVSTDSWAELDAADILLKHFSAPYYEPAKEFVRKLDEAKVWRGRKKRTRKEKKAGSDAGIAKKRKRSNASSATICPPPVPKWTKQQREEAAEKKKQEAADAAAKGVRRSGRATVPSERLLNADVLWVQLSA